MALDKWFKVLNQLLLLLIFTLRMDCSDLTLGAKYNSNSLCHPKWELSCLCSSLVSASGYICWDGCHWYSRPILFLY